MADRDLSIRLTLQDQLSEGLAGIQGRLKDMKLDFKKMAAIGTAGFVAVVGGVGAAVKSYANAGDEIRDMAIKTGFSTTSLSELKHAAELSGASLGTIGTAVKVMGRNMSGLTEEGTQTTDVLKAIGLTTSDLKGLNPEQTFFKLADGISSLPDPMQRSAAALAIFGKQGAELLPLFSEGKDGIAKMREEAHTLGIVFNQEAADAADKFNDSLITLSGGFTGVKNAIAVAFLPLILEVITAITPLIVQVKDWAAENPKWAKGILIAVAAFAGLVAVVGFLGLALPFIIKGFVFLMGPIGLIIAIIAATVFAVMKLIAIFKLLKEDGDLVWLGIKTMIGEVVDKITAKWTAFGDFFKGLWDGIKNTFKSAINWIIEKVNSFIAGVNKMFSKLGKIGIKPPQIGTIPMLAKGGIVTSPTLAMIGEAGPEAVIPLSQMGRMGGGLSITITGNTFMGDRDAAERIGDQIMRTLRQNMRLTNA